MSRIVRTLPALAIVTLLWLPLGARGELSYRVVAPGIERAETSAQSAPGAAPARVWIYRPAARHVAGSLPVVLVAPAGSNGLTGIDLSPEDEPEHLPYVRQGFVVVATEVDGKVTRGATTEDFLAAARAYVHADGGVRNFSSAIDLAARLEPAIDARRVYAAGHSSAGTIALRAAAKLEGIRGVVAYAPAGASSVNAATLDVIAESVSGLKRIALDESPRAFAARIGCPTFLFHAADDDVVPIEQTRALADEMKEAGNPPLVTEDPRGGHTNAMMLRGLEQGATWLADRARRDRDAAAATKPAAP